MTLQKILPAAALLCVGMSVSAMAQDKIPVTNAEKDHKLAATPVPEREQEGYSAKGLNLGGFTAFPLLELSERFTNNLFYEQSRHRQDMITIAAPSLRVRSNWTVHEVEVFVGGTVERHNRFSKEDVENFDSYFTGKLDIDKDAFIKSKLTAKKGQEPDGYLGSWRLSGRRVAGRPDPSGVRQFRHEKGIRQRGSE
jgi:hypothetical protein